VVVSHDRYLVERVCDTVVALLGDGKITHLPGGIEEYLRRRAADVTAGQAQAGARAGGSTRALPGVGSARAAPTQAPRPGAEQRTARREAARLERRLETLTGQEKRLHEQMVEAATNPDRLLALDSELRAVVAERESVELEWLTAAEAAE
jgi:ABC transport system ATP-binding/permease protein